jgi:hypothetical protein
VKELDGKTLMDAAREYERLRRGNRQLTLIIGGSGLVFLTTLFASAHFGNHVIPSVLSLLFLCAAGPIYLRAFLTGYGVYGFRCPRCGKRCSNSWRGSWPTDRCKHCRLDLGAAARSAEKPKSSVDFLE